MQSSVSIDRVGVSAADLPDAATLLDSPGPFATVVMPTSLDEADSASRFEARWGALRRELAGRGAPDDVLATLHDALAGARTDAAGLCCIVAPDGRLAAASGPEPASEGAWWDSLPRLGALLTWHQSTPPALLVVVDRTGADIVAGGPEHVPWRVVDGSDPRPVERVAVGGWSQRRYQERALGAWRANAGEVAAAVATAAVEVDARLIVVAGDERAADLVVDQLPDMLRGLVRRVSGGRGAGSEGQLEVGSARWYRTVVAEDSVAVIDRFKEQLGRGDRAVAGVEDVLASLRSAAVDTVLLHDDPRDGRRVFFRASDRTAIATAEAALEGTDLRDGRLVDAVIAAAWATGAQVRLVPNLPELTDGLGAVLRYRSAR